MKRTQGVWGWVILVAAAHSLWAAAAETPEGKEPMRIRDLLWVWGNPEMAEDGPHSLATFAQAGPAERARLLGVPNIVMAGHGLPRDDAKAEELAQGVAHAPRLVWEVSTDDESGGPPFEYVETVARVQRLAATYPQIEGVLLDDMSTRKIDRGFKPEHIRQLRDLLAENADRIKVWGVLYTMSMDRERIYEYLKELDVINLWTWHARDIVDLEENVARCEQLFPDKPIVLGLYMYDYGAGRRIPLDLLEQQCATALELAHAGRVRGIVLLTITNDPEALTWTANWIQRVGDQKLGATPARPP